MNHFGGGYHHVGCKFLTIEPYLAISELLLAGRMTRWPVNTTAGRGEASRGESDTWQSSFVYKYDF